MLRGARVFDSMRCLLAAGIVLSMCILFAFVLPTLLIIFWSAPILAGVAAGYRVRRPASHAAVGAAVGYLCFEATALAIEDTTLQMGPEWVGLACLMAIFAALGGGAAAVTARLYPPLAMPPGHCQTCGYDLTGNTSGRCSECGSPVDQPHDDAGGIDV